MELRDRLASRLDARIALLWDVLREIRIRIGRPARYMRLDGGEEQGPVTDASSVQALARMLMEDSLYACEDALREGYFTAAGGCRVGVCGKMPVNGGRIRTLSAIGSLCIRIPRQIKGCAKDLLPHISGNLLILSPPGLGKTTLLRDLARLASESGLNVAVADERGELAACREGVPQLDLGSRTDVMDACPKALAIPMLVRACAPDVIIADEIGGEGDGQALRDAAFCGVHIAASAHAGSMDDAFCRLQLQPLFRDRLFGTIVLLGETPGKIVEIKKMIRGGADQW